MASAIRSGGTSTSRSLAPRNIRSVPSPSNSPQASPRCRSSRGPRTNGPPVVAVVAVLDGHRELPARRGGVAGHGFGRQPRIAWHDQRRPLLALGEQRDVHIAVPRFVWLRPAGEPWQLRPLDDHGERPDRPRRPPRGPRRRWRRGVLLVRAPQPADVLQGSHARKAEGEGELSPSRGPGGAPRAPPPTYPAAPQTPSRGRQPFTPPEIRSIRQKRCSERNRMASGTMVRKTPPMTREYWLGWPPVGISMP